MDFSTLKALTIPQGYVVKIEVNGVTIWEMPSSYTNQVPISIDADGSVFNGTGYQDGMRVRSGGALGSWSGAVATGFIPVKAGDVILFTCNEWDTRANNGNTINFGYISGGVFTSLGSYTTGGAVYGLYSSSSEWEILMATKVRDGIWKQVVPPNASITHMRMSCYGAGADLIVTVNEEITD